MCRLEQTIIKTFEMAAGLILQSVCQILKSILYLIAGENRYTYPHHPRTFAALEREVWLWRLYTPGPSQTLLRADDEGR